jgi:hypothetical protein
MVDGDTVQLSLSPGIDLSQLTILNYIVFWNVYVENSTS